jgi:hypothetical protein
VFTNNKKCLSPNEGEEFSTILLQTPHFRCDVISAMKLLLRFLFLVLVVSASVFYFLYPDGHPAPNAQGSTNSSTTPSSQDQIKGQGLVAVLSAPRSENAAQIKG